MKFEDILSEKFRKFQQSTVSNLEMVIGGWTDTEEWHGTTEIDRVETWKGGPDGTEEHTTYAADWHLWHPN